MDIKTFNNGLDVDATVDLMEKQKNPDVVKEFLKTATQKEFLVPYKENEGSLCVLNKEGEEKMLLLFSSYEAFLKSPFDHEKASVMQFSKLGDIVNQSKGELGGMLINPYGKSITFKHELKKSEVRFSKPTQMPTAIFAALNGFFAASDNVYKAYLLWAQKENELAPHLFLLVDFDGKQEELFPRIAEAIKPFIGAGEKLEMAKADMKLLSAAEKIEKPFYKK